MSEDFDCIRLFWTLGLCSSPIFVSVNKEGKDMYEYAFLQLYEALHETTLVFLLLLCIGIKMSAL